MDEGEVKRKYIKRGFKRERGKKIDEREVKIEKIERERK